jgi:hypothetical protein
MIIEHCKFKLICNLATSSSIDNGRIMAKWWGIIWKCIKRNYDIQILIENDFWGCLQNKVYQKGHHMFIILLHITTKRCLNCWSTIKLYL